MVMVITFVVMAKKESMKTIMQPMRIALFSFGVMFAIGLLVFNLMVSANFIHSAIFDESLYWQTIAVQIFVIATAEEVMFRGVLLGYTGIIISSVLFALWHSYAYEVIWYSSSISSVSIVAIIIAFLFGILLSFVARSKFGISGCIALHSSFNLVVLGVLIL
jgi:membrane protease YdiL (CAAX protease family)